MSTVKGLTLIELLVVLVVIGLLAAVLSANLLASRRAADDRGAQTYARSVYTVAGAFLAENIDALALDVERACGAGTQYSPGAGTSYSIGDPGRVVTACEVTAIDTIRFVVSVTSVHGAQFDYPDGP